jgi:hypothetical protein
MDKRKEGDSAAAACLFNFQYSMLSISGAQLPWMDPVGYNEIQDPLMTHSTVNMTP